MFNLFNNNKEKKRKEEDSEFLMLVQKWEAFLEKLDTRFTESLANAEEALVENLIASDYDINSTLRAWSGIQSQLMELADKPNHTFDDVVEPQMLDYKERYQLNNEGQKGSKLRSSIYNRLRRFEIIIEGKISQQYYDHAIKFASEDFNCTQCSGKLEIKKDIFRSHYVSCDYCSTVNTFTPNDKLAQLSWIPENIAKHRAIAEWDAKNKALEEYQNLRGWREGDDFSKHKLALAKREAAERKYWEKYFRVRYSMLSEREASFEHDVNIKMRDYYEYRKREYNY